MEGENRELNTFDEREYHNLLLRAEGEGLDTLSYQERQSLAEFGHYYLEVEKNEYGAMRTFEALQDFEGLRKIADTLLRDKPDHYDLPEIITFLEDHEGIRNLLNRDDIEFERGYGSIFERTFEELNDPLNEHIHKFLDENGTPVATGVINRGIDLIAIRNLAQQYDIAVPIARGGLYQGAIADFWEMPTRTIDIAAHRRKVPKGKWVKPVTPEDFAGKNVLLFDKDAVTGASVRKALKMLEKFKPASVGAYFAHNPVPQGGIGIGTIAESLPPELETFYPQNAPLQEAGDIYIEAHEKLGTLYGRRRQMEQLFNEEAEKVKEQFPKISESLRNFAAQQFSTFDSLNPYLEGVYDLRENMLLRAEQMYKEHQDCLKNNLYNLPNTQKNFRRMLSDIQPLPLDFENDLVRARYKTKIKEATKKRNVENPHLSSDPLGAFVAAQEAVKKGFDVAVIVGPEGFAYEPYFQDLGLPTLAVNIPESGVGESRTIQLFEDLSQLQGKKVLVVEDDIRTGATLQKLLEQLRPYNPGQLGLYLGQPKGFQKMKNIPPDFSETCIAGEIDHAEAGKQFIEYLGSKGLRIFKNIPDNQ